MVSSATTRKAKKAKKAEEAAEQARIALEATKKDAPDPPLGDEENQEDKDPGSPDDKDSNSDSDDDAEDTTPSVIPKPPAGHKGATASSKKHSGKRSGASSSSKKNKKPKTKGSLLVPSLKLFSGFPPKGAADPIRDKAVSKALAVQATYVPKIPPAVVKDLLTNPALTFVLFESLLTGLDHRLWMKALVENLPAGALLPAQVSAITDGPMANDQCKQYIALKALLIKTYTSVDAPEQAREALTKVSMNAAIGPVSLAVTLKNSYSICQQYTACDVSAITLLRAFVENIPSKVRQIIFRNETLTEMCAIVRTYDEHDLNWLDPLVKKAQDIWVNLVESGELTATKTDLLSISADGETPKKEGTIAQQVAAGIKAGLAAANLSKTNIHTSKKGNGKKKFDYTYRGDITTATKEFEAKLSDKDLAARRALIESGKRIVNKDGPKGACTHDYLFDGDYVEIKDTRKKNKGKNMTRNLRVCVRCHKTGHTASRCTESGPTPDRDVKRSK